MTEEVDKSFLNEKYAIVFEYLDEEIKIVREKQEDLKNKKFYIKTKSYSNVKDYINYVNKKTNKCFKICELLNRQINNLPNIWSKFSENHNNYKIVEELKSQCKEIIKTIDFVEKEREELISVVPPVNLEKLHSVYLDIYNPIFNFISEFLYRLSLIEIEDLEDSRIKKYLIDENGKKVIDMRFDILFDKEINAIKKETEMATKKIQRIKKSRK